MVEMTYTGIRYIFMYVRTFTVMVSQYKLSYAQSDAVVIKIIDEYSLFQSCSRWNGLKCLRRVNLVAIFLRFHTQTTHPPSTREKDIFFQSNEAFNLQGACMDGTRSHWTWGCWSEEEPWLAGLIELSPILLLSHGEKKNTERERENFKLSLIKLPSGQQALLWPVKCCDVSCAPPHCLYVCRSYYSFKLPECVPVATDWNTQKSNFMNVCFSLDLSFPVLWLLTL